jgi:hypothetical protein
VDEKGQELDSLHGVNIEWTYDEAVVRPLGAPDDLGSFAVELGHFIETDMFLAQLIGEAQETKLTAILKDHGLTAEVSFKVVRPFVFDPQDVSMTPGSETELQLWRGFVGEGQKFRRDENSPKVDVTDASQVTFTSSNPDVARVVGSKVVAFKVGECEIRAVHADHYRDDAKVRVRVLDPELSTGQSDATSDSGEL